MTLGCKSAGLEHVSWGQPFSFRPEESVMEWEGVCDGMGLYANPAGSLYSGRKWDLEKESSLLI